MEKEAKSKERQFGFPLLIMKDLSSIERRNGKRREEGRINPSFAKLSLLMTYVSRKYV